MQQVYALTKVISEKQKEVEVKHMHFSNHPDLVYSVPYEDRKSDWERVAIDRFHLENRVTNTSKILLPVLNPQVQSLLYHNGQSQINMANNK